jgi:putative ABC transport system permease protein
MRLFKPWLSFQLFLRSSRVQKKRAFLTVAAIAWGSLSLVLLLAFGEGLKRQLMLARSGMGNNIAVMWPGETTLPWEGMPAGRPIRPRYDDLELLRTRLQNTTGVVGEMVTFRPLTNGRTTVNGRLIGVSLEYGELRNHIPATGGRFLNVLDDQRRRRVVFLGDALAEEVFGEVDAVGRELLIDNVPYTVIGILEKRLQMGTYGGPDEDHAIIPITTFMAQFGRERLSNIVVQADRAESMPAVIKQVREVLGAKYGFDPEDERVLPTWDTVEGAKIMGNMTLGIQLFLGIIGALTLVVGGIGVANIMYAVVKERTKEIGVKMALGARSKWVTGPLILEGLTYTLLGGLLGLIMAMGLVMLLEMIPTEGNDALEFLGKPTLSLPIAIATAGILGLIGLLAAYFPARRAALVDPAETLRYE